MKQNSFSYQTSEKIKIEYKIAIIPFRIAALLIDMAIVFAVFWVLYFLLIFLFIGHAITSEIIKSNVSLYIILIFYSIIGLLVLLYPFLFELVWKGQTPGKKMLHLRAVNDDGSYLNLTNAILRNIFRIVDWLPVGYLTGFITMLLNKKRKRIGDFVAGTIVIKERKVAIPKFKKNNEVNCFLNAKNLKNKFSNHDKKIMESYFQSKGDLYFNALDKIEKEIVNLIEKKTNIKKPKNIYDEDFIYALYQYLE